MIAIPNYATLSKEKETRELSSAADLKRLVFRHAQLVAEQKFKVALVLLDDIIPSARGKNKASKGYSA